MSRSADQYLNRELSWLAFNQRVLDLASKQEVPLLERVKFLAITASNLDEFFKVRVGGLTLALQNKVESVEITGLTVNEQLNAITSRVQQMNSDQANVLLRHLLPGLEENGIHRLQHEQLNEQQKAVVEEIFDNEIASVVAPIMIERGQQFPLLSSAKQCICVRIKNDSSRSVGHLDDAKLADERFAVISLGSALRRFIKLPQESGHAFMLLEDVVGQFLHKLFPEQEILEWVPFRITRNADIALNDDLMHDLLLGMTAMLEARKVSEIIRVEVDSGASDSLLQFLRETTNASDRQLYRIEGPLDLVALFELAEINGYSKLKDEPWPAKPSSEFLDSPNVFETIAAGDRILLHPYQQYDPVINFLRAAAEDPDVIAIKQTLYRSSRNSAIVDALAAAAANGKQVTAIVELKARFDEARNILGAKRLEQAGVDVIYGVQGLKTHAKLCIAVRRESRGIQRYVHFGTGNYNESTAKLYSDVSYFTNNEQLGADAVMFFNAITGLSVPQPLQLLAAAPIDLKDTLLNLIQVEIENAKQNGTSAINAKVNSLVDKQIIDALYDASAGGVKIRLNVRGICCLKPGVPGLSENIEVVSIVDRLLEHSRIIHFDHGGNNLVYISSADWMGRNLNRRAELLVPIEDKACSQMLLSVLTGYFKDNVRANRLTADGEYVPVATDGEPFRIQQHLYQQVCDQYAAFANPKATVFKAHRGESA